MDSSIIFRTVICTAFALGRLFAKVVAPRRRPVAKRGRVAMVVRT